MKRKRVALVIVTYNRLLDLKKCLESLKNQTERDFDIIVVNNGSTDSTQEYLSACNGIKVIEQENCGGAGGFYAGMKYMFDNGYEWLWMMDDDGIPDRCQLENLLIAGKNYKFLNSLVLDISTKNELAFPNKNLPSLKDCLTTDYWPFMHPFNGTFIHRSVIEKIGFIKKEMFIWGDEEEYTQRARMNGIETKTYTRAIHYHPHERGKSKCAIPYVRNYFQVIDKPLPLCCYYYRNRGYILHNYYSIKEEIKFLLYQTLYLLRTCKFKKLSYLYKFYFAGRRNDYNSLSDL